MTVERKFDAKSMLGMLRRYEATTATFSPSRLP